MNETSLNHAIRDAMRPLGVFTRRIENRCDEGTPDLYIRSFGKSAWVENKYLKSFPKRTTTPVKIDHFTSEQRLWLRGHGWGAWLFAQVGDEYFLFDHLAAQNITGWNREQWIQGAAFYCKKPCDWKQWLKTVLLIKEQR